MGKREERGKEVDGWPGRLLDAGSGFQCRTRELERLRAPLGGFGPRWLSVALLVHVCPFCVGRVVLHLVHFVLHLVHFSCGAFGPLLVHVVLHLGLFAWCLA